MVCKSIKILLSHKMQTPQSSSLLYQYCSDGSDDDDGGYDGDNDDDVDDGDDVDGGDDDGRVCDGK